MIGWPAIVEQSEMLAHGGEVYDLLTWVGVILMCLVAGTVVILVVVNGKWPRRPKHRGFEVKPITGSSPVLEERDKTNG